MNKSQLISNIADKANLTKADTTRALEAFLETITHTLQKDGTVSLVGFGTFSVKEKAERKGRNPQTGEEITIPARKVASCKLSKTILNN